MSYATETEERSAVKAACDRLAVPLGHGWGPCTLDTNDVRVVVAAARAYLDLPDENGSYLCRGCHRPEGECSLDPCDDVIADRES